MGYSNEIRFTDVSFAFDVNVIIQSFSQIIQAGEHVCLMGESGAGKSTLLNSVVGLTTPSQGEIRVSGLTLNAPNIHQIRSLTAWLPQELNLPYDTVKETLFAPYQLKVNKLLTFDKQRLFAFFGQVGLDTSIYEKQMNSISGGERQRLMLISALMLDKKILLLDEPTSALDGSTRNKLTEFLQTLTTTTILAVTHDEQFAHSFNRTILLKKREDAIS